MSSRNHHPQNSPRASGRNTQPSSSSSALTPARNSNSNRASPSSDRHLATSKYDRNSNPQNTTALDTYSDDSSSDYDVRGRRDRGSFRDEEQPRRGEGAEEEEEGEGRRWKYSSQGMARPQEGGLGGAGCRKCCCIALLFLLFMAFSIGISFLINYLFFRDEDSSSTPETFDLPANQTVFPRDKAQIDSACSSSIMDADGGLTCKQYCEPVYSACCLPFEDSDIFNQTTGAADATTAATQAPKTTMATIPGTNVTVNLANCSLDVETRGCVSYSKCMVLATGFDPAPAALPNYCSKEILQKDNEACISICEKHKCCYAERNGKHMNCLGDILDVCLDYAPCQMLRTGSPNLLEPAPTNLDQLCFYKSPDCELACKKAECCNFHNNTSSSCFANNVVSCLTYAACGFSNNTWQGQNLVKNKTQILPPIFSVLPPLPAELKAACKAWTPDGSGASSISFVQTCDQHCKVAECCNATHNKTSYCFNKDPLGCLAWEQQCQVLRVGQQQ